MCRGGETTFAHMPDVGLRAAILGVHGLGAKVREEGTERDNVGERNKGACGR